MAIGNLIFPWDQDNGQRYQDGRGRVSKREFVAADVDGMVGWISGHHGSTAWANLAAYEDRPEYWACSWLLKFYVQEERQSGGASAPCCWKLLKMTPRRRAATSWWSIQMKLATKKDSGTSTEPTGTISWTLQGSLEETALADG